MEPAAETIRTYEAELIPGLLQTRDYAAAVYQARNTDDSTAESERRVAVRMERQAILDRLHPPRLHVVLNEAAVLREVGGPDVMAEQVIQRPGITIGVLPLTAGAHAAMGWSTKGSEFDHLLGRGTGGPANGAAHGSSYAAPTFMRS